jgi:hypothetical protein
MNHREPPQLPAGMRKALHCLSLLLVPALTLDQGHAGPRMRTALRASADHAPYLPILGSPSLRVEEAPPPPDLTTKPPAAAPPVPALSRIEASVAVENATAASTSAPVPEPATATPDAAAATPPAAEAAKAPAPILPDTIHPVVHPEDFLPYFEIPGTARKPGEVNVIIPGLPSAPTPGAIPPSSANYTQSPR